MPEEFFNTVKSSLEDGIKFNQKKLDFNSSSVPAEAPQYSAKKVKRIRRKLKRSQTVLAQVLNVSVRTLQAWEQDVRNPDGGARRLLQILHQNSEALLELK